MTETMTHEPVPVAVHPKFDEGPMKMTALLWVHQHCETKEPMEVVLFSADGHVDFCFIGWLEENRHDADVLKLFPVPTEAVIRADIEYQWENADIYDGYWTFDVVKWAVVTGDYACSTPTVAESATVPATTPSLLTWHPDTDSTGRDCWEAFSSMHDDGCPFRYRIRQNGKQFSLSGTDSELLDPYELVTPWASLECAQSVCEQAEAEFRASIEADAQEVQP